MSSPENEYTEQQYLDILKEGSTPFDRFVSRGDIKDPVDIPGPRGEFEQVFLSLVEGVATGGVPRFLPIVGSSGSGKTHTYWALKDREKAQETHTWTVIYVPSPPAAVRILFHVYTCLTNEVPEFIENVSNTLLWRYMGTDVGDLGKSNISTIIDKAKAENPAVFVDAIRAFMTYALHEDKNKRRLAKRWLLGDALDEAEMDQLGVKTPLDSDEACLAMIQIISENLAAEDSSNGDAVGIRSKIMAFFFDEFESPFRTHGHDAEIKLIEKIEQILASVKNIIVIGAILKDVYDHIIDIFSPESRNQVEPAIELQPFTFDDLSLYLSRAQEQFWTQKGMPPPGYLAFPLNDELLKHIFEKSNGNPREAIKLTRVFVEKVVSGDLSLEEFGIKAKVEEVHQAAKDIDAIISREALNVDVNASSLSSAIIIGLQEVTFTKCPDKDAPGYEIGYTFSIGERRSTIGALVNVDEEKVGFDIPSVKSFDRSGGVAAFYSAKRLAEGLATKVFERALLIMPKGSSGQKLQFILEKNPNLIPLEIDQAQATQIVQAALNPGMELSRTVVEITKIVTRWPIDE
jgi:hypothetical protein